MVELLQCFNPGSATKWRASLSDEDADSIDSIVNNDIKSPTGVRSDYRSTFSRAITSTLRKRSFLWKRRFPHIDEVIGPLRLRASLVVSRWELGIVPIYPKCFLTKGSLCDARQFSSRIMIARLKATCASSPQILTIVLSVRTPLNLKNSENFFNTKFQFRPKVIILVECTEQVSEIVRFANEHSTEIDLRVRSGGH